MPQWEDAQQLPRTRCHDYISDLVG